MSAEMKDENNGQTLEREPKARGSSRAKVLKASAQDTMQADDGQGTRLPVGLRTAWVNPASLDEHALSRKYFEFGDADAQAELVESVRARTYKRLLVTGERCASPPGVVLDGRRLRRAALKAGVLVEVEYIDDLDADAELELMIHSNIASGLARRLDERRKAELERLLIESFGRRQGRRTDLTPADSSGGSGETRALVAEAMNESRNAVADRQTVFFSPVSPELLKTAVNDGRIKRSPAAKLIREAQSVPEVALALDEMRKDGTPLDRVKALPVIAATTSKVFGEVEALVGKKKKDGKAPVPKAKPRNQADAVLVDGVAEVSYLGRRTRIELTGVNIRLENVGPADDDANIYLPFAATTRTSWVIDVAAAVDYLPADIRAGTSVGEVEILEPVQCPTCGGAIFYRVGGCVRCQAIATVNRDAIEREVRAEVEVSTNALYQSLVDAAAMPPCLALFFALESHATGSNEDAEIVQRAAECVADELRAYRENQSILARARSVREYTTELEARARTQAACQSRRLALGEKDPRVLMDRYDRKANLSRPRARVTVKTRETSVDVVLWARESDSDIEFGRGDGPCIRIGSGSSVLRLGKVDAWNCRAALRNEVLRAILDARPTSMAPGFYGPGTPEWRSWSKLLENGGMIAPILDASVESSSSPQA